MTDRSAWISHVHACMCSRMHVSSLSCEHITTLSRPLPPTPPHPTHARMITRIPSHPHPSLIRKSGFPNPPMLLACRPIGTSASSALVKACAWASPNRAPVSSTGAPGRSQRAAWTAGCAARATATPAGPSSRQKWQEWRDGEFRVRKRCHVITTLRHVSQHCATWQGKP